MTTAIVWFRRDLRVHDHPALRAALETADRVIPFFCFDGSHSSGPRTQFMLECLADLDESLKARGGALVIRHGDPQDELRKLGADGVHANSRATVVEDMKPYVVFSPFYRAWQQEPRREVLPAPREIVLPDGIDPGTIPTLGELGLDQEVDEPMRGGETEGRKLLGGKPRLSPYLNFGCVSAREAEERAPDDDYRRKLAWRDFFYQVLENHPENAQREFQHRYREMAWEDDPEALQAWKDGRTGYPFVDAGMRQLKREGWMPNRVRLVVASFLVKQLGIDWREGERHFMRLLLDGDQANNNGNWQWIASVGVDPAPYFRRLYNPTRQMETHDPSGEYVRRYVPELGGPDYPEPIVDQREARERAIARYRAAAANAG